MWKQYKYIKYKIFKILFLINIKYLFNLLMAGYMRTILRLPLLRHMKMDAALIILMH